MNRNRGLLDFIKIGITPFLVAGIIYLLLTGLYYTIDPANPTKEDKLLLALFTFGLLFLGSVITNWVYLTVKRIILHLGHKSKEYAYHNKNAGPNDVTEYVNKNSMGFKYLDNVDYITESNEYVKDNNLQQNQLAYIKKFNYVNNIKDILEYMDIREEKLIKKRDRAEKFKMVKRVQKLKIKNKTLMDNRIYAKDLMDRFEPLNELKEVEDMENEYRLFKYKWKRVKSKVIRQSQLLSFTDESLDFNEALNKYWIFRWWMNIGRVWIPGALIGSFYLFYVLTEQEFIDETLQQGIKLIMTSIGISSIWSIGWGFTGRFANKYLRPTNDLSAFYNMYMPTIKKD